jgi:myo-inositol-1(or 4)-monophosphatase
MIDIMKVLNTALDEGGAVLARHFGRLEQIDRKSETDLVTVADRESEAAIKRVIHDAFPTHQILGEESGEDYAGRTGDYRWIIDPLDGTTNYAHSMPMFAVSIGVERRGEIVAGGVLNPVSGERYLAEQGSGARLNGKPLRVSQVATLRDSLLVTGFPYDRRLRLAHYMDLFGRFLNAAQSVLRLGSASLDLCAVASGRLEGFWEEKLHAWDVAAGWLIVQEAGGRITDFAGRAATVYGVELLATNGLIHDECVKVLAGR